MLDQLGYEINGDGTDAIHPDGRRAFFVGDLVDRGPAVPAVLRLAMGMVEAGHALAIPGNHENKLARALKGSQVTTGHGLAETLRQLEAEPPEFSAKVTEFIDGLVSHFVLDDSRLVVAHAGMREDMAGRSSGAVRSFALYGDTTGETDEYGLPVRYPWAQDYRGKAAVVYGHTPSPEAVWVNNTICIDTGCVFGGKLTALRWPERELVSVPARQVYWEPVRPLSEEQDASDSWREPTDLDISDVLGKKIITTRVSGHTVTIREENGAAALEVMSRFAADPRWLIYLPPTMAPTATTSRTGLLEHPDEAFDAFARDGVPQVVCEEKHMGSRAIAVICRDPEVAARRFSITNSTAGAIFTRTGRPFLTTPGEESALLANVGHALTTANIWDELGSDWVVLDCELLPWSAKAGELLRRQYASVGAAALASLAAETSVLEAVAARGVEAADLADGHRDRHRMAAGFVNAYRRYCWPVSGIDDLRLAPFQILAAEGKVHALTNHHWHLDILGRLCSTDPGTFRSTQAVTVDLADQASREAGVDWWEQLTGTGGEGMVVKPADPVHKTQRGISQPGIKVRGPEYLRIIYGPEYTAEANLSRLRERGLGHKRSLALREFALGIEALERFVAGEPLYRVHECVFGVLALESEPVDPRL
jgi:protein phosphatase